MKKITRLLAITASAVLALASCKPKEEPIVPSISVSPSSVTFVAASPAAANVTVTSNVEWKADAADTWVTVSPKAGSGNGSIAITAATNVAPEGSAAPARSSKVTLTIEGKKIDIQVNQDAENLVFAVEGTPTEVPAAGASVSVKVDANTSYQMSSSADWCVLATKADTKAVKTDNLKFVVAENTAFEARTATITFTPASGSAKTVTVNQAAAEKPKEHNIDSADTFAEFAAALKTGDVSAFDLDGDKVVKLTADIEVGALAEPLDTLPAGITLDGDNHQIKYAIETTSIDMKDLGLFSAVEGTVKNLKVAGSIKESAEAGSGTYHIGGVAGYLGAAGVIDNCQSSVDILGDTKVTHHMGGIVGFTAAGAVVKNCINEGSVKMAIPELAAANASQIGGIIGHIESATDVLDCENKGTLTYEGNGTPRLAGIVGYVNNLVNVNIKNTKNSGNIVWVEGAYTASSWSYVGGFTGYNGTPKDKGVLTYENCVNTGDITCTITEANSRVRVGGIMSHGGSTTATNALTYNLKNCSNSGTITVTSATADRTVAGGIVGFAETNATVNVDGCTFSGTIDSKAGAKAGGIIGALANKNSTITNITIDEKAVLKSEGGFKKGNVGIIGGQNTAYTTAVSGKVAGTIIDGDKTWKVNKNNYQNHLFGVALGEGGSTEAVTCDVDGEPDPGEEPEKPAALPFTETFTNNNWTKDDADSGEALSDTQLTQFKNISSVYWARTGLGGIKLGTSSKVGSLDTKDLDLSKDFYVKISAAAYGASEGKLIIKVGTDSREIDLTAAGDKVPTEYVENFKATDAKNITFATVTKRAYIQSITINYGQASAPVVKTIGSVNEFAALLANKEALADASTTYKLTADLDLGGNAIPAAAGELAATIDGQKHVVKNAKIEAPVFASVTGALKNIALQGATMSTAIVDVVAVGGLVSGVSVDATSTIQYATPTASVNLGTIVNTNEGTVEKCSSAIAYAQEFDALPASTVSFGGVVGYTKGLAKDCSNTGKRAITVAAPAKSTFHNFGGVVGAFEGTAGQTMVKGCSNTAEVSVTYTTAVYFYTGGVVGGTPSAKNAPGDYGVVEGCSNTGLVTMHYINGGSGAYPNIGGVVGYAEAALKSCVNSGDIKVVCDSESATWTCPRVAGVAGFVSRGAVDCHNHGAISVKGLYAGGTAGNRGAGNTASGCFAGVIASAGPYTADAAVIFENCTNDANITVTPGSITGSPNTFFGGVFGHVSGKMKNCHNMGNLLIESWIHILKVGGVTGGSKLGAEGCTNTGAVISDHVGCTYNNDKVEGFTSVRSYIGGIIGDLSGAVDASTVIKNCTNSGAVTVKSTGATLPSSYISTIGGIVGCRKAGYEIAAEGCSNTGTLTCDSANLNGATDNVCGGDYGSKVQ